MAQPAKKKDTRRQSMPEQAPEDRVNNFDEVPYGYSEELAMVEALRCILCKNPKCVAACPVNINIPAFVGLIQQGKFLEAARQIKQDNALPAVCGRVCPQEEQCEGSCVIGIKHEPVAIGRLERFAADYERHMGTVTIPTLPAKSGKHVAVVGAGPAGLTVAGDLILKGMR